MFLFIGQFVYCELKCTDKINKNKSTVNQKISPKNENPIDLSVFSSQLSKDSIVNNAELTYGDLYGVPIHKCQDDAQIIMRSFFTNPTMNIYNHHGFHTTETTQDIIKYYLKKSKEKGIKTYYVFFQIKGSEVMRVGLAHIYSGTADNEISFYFGVEPALCRRKIGTKIAMAIIDGIKKFKTSSDHHFHSDMKNINVIEVLVHADNPGSNGVFRKLKFTQGPVERLRTFKKARRWTLEI
jgi:RimJ/RimL family protein N-acetyltransferase